jgi:hypothetical protein
MLGQKIDNLWKKIDEGFSLIALLILSETPEEKRKLAKKILGEKEQILYGKELKKIWK